MHRLGVQYSFLFYALLAAVMLCGLLDGRGERWVALLLAAMPIATMGALSYGWETYSLMILQGDGYISLCSTKEIGERESWGGAACLAQEKRVGDLFSILSATQAVSGFVGGISFDHLGPRTTAMIGLIMSGASRMLLAVADGGHRDWAIDASIVIDGLCVTLVNFPALAIVNQFPDAPSLAVSVIEASTFLGNTVCALIWIIWKQHPAWSAFRLWSLYTLCICLPMIGCYWIALPSSKRHKAYSLAVAEASRLELASITNVQNIIDEERMLSTTPLEEELIIDEERTSLASAPHDMPRLASRWSLFVDEIISRKFWVFTLAFSTNLVMHKYYMVIIRRMSGLATSEMLGKFMMTQCVWALLGGWIGEYMSSGMMVLILSFSMSAVLYLSILGTGAVEVAAVIFTIIDAILYTTRLTYTCDVFSNENRGKVLGVMGAFGAAVLLLNIPINRVDNLTLTSSILGTFNLLCIPAAWHLNYVFFAFQNGSAKRPRALKFLQFGAVPSTMDTTTTTTKPDDD